MYTNSGVQAYRQADINSMSREKMIVLLYEKIVSDLNEADEAIARGDRVAMTKRVNHSQRIICELRNSLDHSIGGDVSRNLESLYDFLFHEHLEVLVDQDPSRIANCLRVINPLLEAWRSIPIGTGEQAARDRARGRLKTADTTSQSGGPDPATSSHNPVADRTAADDTQIATPASELVSVSA